MQLVGPHLASFGDDAGTRRMFGMADVVEFRFLVGQWHLGRRAIREVSSPEMPLKERRDRDERKESGADFECSE